MLHFKINNSHSETKALALLKVHKKHFRSLPSKSEALTKLFAYDTMATNEISLGAWQSFLKQENDFTS